MDRTTALETYASFGLNTPMFSLAGTSAWARVVDVYDGDTLTLVIAFRGGVHRFRARIQGIDTSELRSKDAKNAARAVRARDRLIRLITKEEDDTITFPSRVVIKEYLGRTVYLVWVECFRTDRYGRIIVVLRDGPNDHRPSYGDVLLSEKLAYAYSGLKRLSPEEQNRLLEPEETAAASPPPAIQTGETVVYEV